MQSLFWHDQLIWKTGGEGVFHQDRCLGGLIWKLHKNSCPTIAGRMLSRWSWTNRVADISFPFVLFLFTYIDTRYTDARWDTSPWAEPSCWEPIHLMWPSEETAEMANTRRYRCGGCRDVQRGRPCLLASTAQFLWHCLWPLSKLWPDEKKLDKGAQADPRTMSAFRKLSWVWGTIYCLDW